MVDCVSISTSHLFGGNPIYEQHTGMPPSKRDPEIAQTDNESIRGILLALRYLSREAEGAGLKELARTLEEAELKCDRRTENTREPS